MLDDLRSAREKTPAFFRLPTSNLNRRYGPDTWPVRLEVGDRPRAE
jgi:hypothetical protein